METYQPVASEILIEKLRITSAAFNVAYILAEETHIIDKRSDGRPYMTHIDMVIYLVFGVEFKRGTDLKAGSKLWLKLIVAALHDAYEDHPKTCTITLIHTLLLPFLGEEQTNEVTDAIVAISKRDSNPRTYPKYIGDIFKNELARPVKIADLKHNLSDLTPGSRKDKYELSLSILTGDFIKLITNEC